MNSRQRIAKSKVDLTMVYTLKALLDTGNVSKAADRLGVSQPSISQALKRLREVLGDPLFVRSGNQLQPTPRAMALAHGVAQVAQTLELMEQPPTAFTPATAQRHFVVSFSDIAEFNALPRLALEMRQEAPACTLRSVRPAGSDLVQALERGDIDLATGTLVGNARQLRQLRLGEYGFSCLTSPTGRWARKSLGLENFVQAAHVVVPRASDGVDPVEQRLDLQGIHRHVALVVANHFAACGVVAAADMIFTLPAHLAVQLAKMFGLRVQPLPVDVGTVVTRIVWHERFHHDEANIWLRKRVERLFREGLPQMARRGK